MRRRREPVACGVDIGSTNVKVVALDHGGTVVARAGRPTPRDVADPSLAGSAVIDAVEALILDACGERYQVEAICTVGVGEDGLLVDPNLRPLTPALAWFDPRRRGIYRALRPQLAGDTALDAADDAARTMIGWWWARQQPNVDRARSWVAVADLPSVHWTGMPFLSDTLASRTGAWRAATRAWDDPRVAATLGSLDLLPPLRAAGEVLGPVVSPVLRSTDAVAPGALVVVGGHDHPIGGWAVDQLQPGAVLDSMGTAEVVVAQSPAAPVLRRDHVDIAPGIRSTGSTVLQVIELARNVEWACQDPTVAAAIHAILDGSAQPEPILEAGHFRPGQRGGRPPSYGLGSPNEPLGRASAVLGALACVGRTSIEAVQQRAAGQVVRLAGGWARSPGWVDIKESVNGFYSEPVVELEVTAVGAALLAALALDWEPSLATALRGP